MILELDIIPTSMKTTPGISTSQCCPYLSIANDPQQLLYRIHALLTKAAVYAADSIDNRFPSAHSPQIQVLRQAIPPRFIAVVRRTLAIYFLFPASILLVHLLSWVNLVICTFPTTCELPRIHDDLSVPMVLPTQISTESNDFDLSNPARMKMN